MIPGAQQPLRSKDSAGRFVRVGQAPLPQLPDGIKAIALQHGLHMLVDEVDFERVSRLSWSAIKRKNTWYATTTPKDLRVLAHRFILGIYDSRQVDHKDGNGLNNTRLNLRPATALENSRNQRRRRTNKSGFKGVRPLYGKFQARLKVNGEEIRLGYFPTAEIAAQAYDAAALEHFGEFACLNFPERRHVVDGLHQYRVLERKSI